MSSKHRLQLLPLYLLLVLLYACPQADPDPECPDPTNSECPDYNPCHPLDCSKIVIDKINSTALESNLVNEETERSISVYLPEGYETESSRTYPVLYLLHGYTANHSTWFGGPVSEVYGPEGQKGMDVKKMLDSQIREGTIEPMIVVCADNYNRFEGSYYTNSIVTGNWEDFMVDELVSHIDSKYRTLAVPESRGIAGHSMGAYGAMKLAMKNPDVFSVVYSLSGTLEYVMTFLNNRRDEIIEANQITSWNTFIIPYVKVHIVRALAFAPNPALSPFMGELPLDENGTRIDSTWHKWLEHDLYSMLNEYSENLKLLKKIRFDCGSNDRANISCKNFSDALTQLDIDHLFESYPGDHLDGIPERMETNVLPFFSENLEH